jgi:hypothetical protein
MKRTPRLLPTFLTNSLKVYGAMIVATACSPIQIRGRAARRVVLSASLCEQRVGTAHSPSQRSRCAVGCYFFKAFIRLRNY